MPSRHTVKEHLPEAVYHAYNRGVERRRIFIDSHDYQRFKLQIAEALAKEPSVSLLAYCLMPNHFHLLIHQSDSVGMTSFMRRVSTAYVMYFNRRHARIGSLFQGKYKAVRVTGALHLMEESRYVHLNPERAGLGWRQHLHSSAGAYLGKRFDPLLTPEPILELFDHPSDYVHYLSSGKVRPRAKRRNIAAARPTT
jgi:putative transposase